MNNSKISEILLQVIERIYQQLIYYTTYFLCVEILGVDLKASVILKFNF